MEQPLASPGSAKYEWNIPKVKQIISFNKPEGFLVNNKSLSAFIQLKLSAELFHNY